jgi:hypothetical protein
MWFGGGWGLSRFIFPKLWMTAFDRIDFKLTGNWLKKVEHIKDLNSN